jgi:hypothetical protein
MIRIGGSITSTSARASDKRLAPAGDTKDVNFFKRESPPKRAQTARSGPGLLQFYDLRKNEAGSF